MCHIHRCHGYYIAFVTQFVILMMFLLIVLFHRNCHDRHHKWVSVSFLISSFRVHKKSRVMISHFVYGMIEHLGVSVELHQLYCWCNTWIPLNCQKHSFTSSNQTEYSTRGSHVALIINEKYFVHSIPRNMKTIVHQKAINTICLLHKYS